MLGFAAEHLVGDDMSPFFLPSSSELFGEQIGGKPYE